MNICIAAEGYPAEGYPYYAFVENLCVEWAKQGNNVYVIAPQSISKILKGRPRLPYYSVHAINDASIHIYRPFYLTSFNLSDRFNYWMFSKLASIVLKKIHDKIDVCYGHFWHVAYSLYPSARKYNKPLFVASGEAEIELHKIVKEQSLKPFTEYVSGVICVSTKNKNESVESNLTNEGKCIVLPNAIDDKLFKVGDREKARNKYGLKDDDFVISFVGGFIQRKGPGRVASAITKLNDPLIKSIYVGYSGNGVVDIPQCDGIVFQGALKHEEIPVALNASDVFVMPTLHEGCCNSIIEAMACGLPIISSDRPFNQDVLDNSNSILIDPMDIDGIAAAIKRLKEDKVYHDELAKGSLLMADNLSISKRATKIINFIKGSIA